MQHIGPDVSRRRRKPNGQFDNEFAALSKGSDPFAYERNKVRDWSDLDLSEDEINDWKGAHCTADDAYAWGYGEGYGFYPDQAQAWRSVGIHDPHVADQWASHGFSPTDAVHWAKSGFTSFDQDHPELWRDTGFSDPSDACAWRRAGFNHAEALSWKEIGLQPGDAKLEVNETKNKLHHVPEMYAKHTPQEIQRLGTDSDYAEPYGLYGSKDWRRLGFSPDAAHAWQAIGINPSQAAELRDQLIGDRANNHLNYTYYVPIVP